MDIKDIDLNNVSVSADIIRLDNVNVQNSNLECNQNSTRLACMVHNTTVSNSKIISYMRDMQSDGGKAFYAITSSFFNGTTIEGYYDSEPSGIGVYLEGDFDMDDTVTIIGQASGSDSVGISLSSGTVNGISVTPENITGVFDNNFKGSGVCKIMMDNTCVSK